MSTDKAIQRIGQLEAVLRIIVSVQKECSAEIALAYISQKAREALALKDGKEEPCRIYYHDGTYKCYVHGVMWGAVSNPDVPCKGWVGPGEIRK